MKQRILGIAVLVGLSVSAAAADPVRIAQTTPRLLPAQEIVSIVRSAGFKPISPAMLRGDTYVLRATGPDGREVRMVVMARSGDIVSASPVVAAAPSDERLARHERMDDAPVPPQGYIPPAPPPILHEGDRPMRRPQASIPNAPSRSARAVVPEAQNAPQLSEPPVIMREERGARDDRGVREERGEHGLLPPPPDRFPPRAAPPPAQRPAAKPAPVKRAAATPLPKPKPAEANASAEDASKPPAPPAPPKVDARALPH